MTGTIKLYKISGNCGQPLKIELERYYSEIERKKIIEHWRRKHNGAIVNCFIQIAPGHDLTGKFLTHKTDV
jgi:hypothetical protein